MSTRRSRRVQQDEEEEVDSDDIQEETDEIQEEKEAIDADDENGMVHEPDVDDDEDENEAAAKEDKEGDVIEEDDGDKDEGNGEDVIAEKVEPKDEDLDADKDELKDDEDLDADKENEDDVKTPAPATKKRKEVDDVHDDVAEELLREAPETPMDPEILKQQEIIDSTPRTSELEHALYECLMRKESQVERLSGEVTKLKAFISKRKQTYKRKRKDEGAPTRALSAYNIFVQDRFSKLAKENEQALKSSDSDAQLKRVPPASLVASTGNQWKELSAEEKTAYEERAREDRKRYEEQMAKYQPPDKQANRKRNKTGYNMFFSAHVLRLKQSEAGVPSERGSVARLVGNAWKQLASEEKQYYEREADKMNGMNPVDKDDEDDDGDDKRPPMPEYPPNYPPPHGDMHMHPGMPPPMHGHPQHAAQHDPRHAYHYPPNYAYPQPPYHGYHEQPAVPGQHRHYQGRSHYQYPPPHAAYDQRGMGM